MLCTEHLTPLNDHVQDSRTWSGTCHEHVTWICRTVFCCIAFSPYCSSYPRSQHREPEPGCLRPSGHSVYYTMPSIVGGAPLWQGRVYATTYTKCSYVVICACVAPLSNVTKQWCYVNTDTVYLTRLGTTTKSPEPMCMCVLCHPRVHRASALDAAQLLGKSWRSCVNFKYCSSKLQHSPRRALELSSRQAEKTRGWIVSVR